jgi:hypothetical protein
MYIPPITNIPTALKIYYENTELNTNRIRELFNREGEEIKPSTLTKIRNLVKKEMARRNVQAFGLHSINTKIAYEVWKIDIEELEKNRNKLKKLGLIN